MRDESGDEEKHTTQKRRKSGQIVRLGLCKNKPRSKSVSIYYAPQENFDACKRLMPYVLNATSSDQDTHSLCITELIRQGTYEENTRKIERLAFYFQNTQYD